MAMRIPFGQSVDNRMTHPFRHEANFKQFAWASTAPFLWLTRKHSQITELIDCEHAHLDSSIRRETNAKIAMEKIYILSFGNNKFIANNLLLVRQSIGGLVDSSFHCVDRRFDNPLVEWIKKRRGERTKPNENVFFWQFLPLHQLRLFSQSLSIKEGLRIS